MRFLSKFKLKIITGVICLAILLSILTPVLFYPQPARAVWGGITFDPIHTTETVSKSIWDKMWELGKVAITQGAAIMYRNSINSFLSQAAEDTAGWIATGGAGQRPQFIADEFYWDKLGDQALGTFIDETAQGTGWINQSLCDPIDPTIRFQMLVSLDPVYQRAQWQVEERCSFSKIMERVEEASHEQLIEFSVDLKQGPVGRYKTSLPWILDTDPLLRGWSNSRIILDEITAPLTSIQNEFQKIIDDIKIAKENNRKLDEDYKSTLISLKEELNNEVWGDWREDNDIDRKLKFWQINTPECATKNSKDYCSDKHCMAVCGDQALSSPECSANYINCESITKRANIYIKQIVDWTNSLESMIASVNLDSLDVDTLPTLEDIARMYNPEGNDLGVALALQSRAFRVQAEAIERNKHFQGLQGRLNDVTTHISNLTKTPSIFVDEEARQAVEAGTAGPLQYTGVAAADAVGIFVNTLANKLLTRIFDKGINPAVSPELPGRTNAFLSESGFYRPDKSAVSFSDLAVVTLKKGGEINLLNEYATCPQDKRYALPTNCVIDSGLVRAIEEQMTISEALSKNLLHGDWLVGGKNFIKDTASDYLQRYSLTNLKKLRKARIIPLGIEIAAEKISSGDLGDANFTLQEIVDAFNQEGNPFYRMIDPNWVFKTAGFQCENIAYSATPISNSTQRQEACIDLKDCLYEDEQGQCQAWGYCTREKNLWRMDGNTCDPQYASCQSFKRVKDNQNIAYLTRTLNYDGCDENNAGCKWYCLKWDSDLGGDGLWACQEPGVSIVDDQGTLNEEDQGNAIYFNRKISDCSSKEEGCHQYLRTKADLGSNLIPNGTFSYFEGDANDNEEDNLLGWLKDCPESSEYAKECSSSNPQLYRINKDGTSKGDSAVKIVVSRSGDWTGIVSQDIPIVPQNYPRYFVLSADIYIPDIGSGGGAESGLSGTWELHAHAIGESGVSSFEDLSSENSYQITANDIQQFWIQKRRVIKAEANVDTLRIFLATYGGSGEIWASNFQILETSSAALAYGSYREYGSNNQTYLKEAPDYMKCYDDNLDNDHPECLNYTLQCSANEVGCELYQPINKDPIVPGIVGTQDTCPSSCVGYQSFMEMPSYFNDEQRIINFIPNTANTCSMPGCEEFTNLDAVAQGGEGIEYYSYLRTCAKLPGEQANCESYFTWVGSETTGYQLKKYFLKKATEQYANDPNDQGPQKVNLIADSSIWGSCSGSIDALINPNCKEFYNADGDIYYRIYQNTITCSEECYPYRRTADQRILMSIPSEGIACDKKNNGCREYKGPAANNIRQVFISDFENGVAAPWEGGEISSESINFPGHSLKATDQTQQITAFPRWIAKIFNLKDLFFRKAKAANQIFDYSIRRDVSYDIRKNKSYFISFWVKGVDQISVKFKSSAVLSRDGLNSTEWQEVKLGPFYFSSSPASDEVLQVFASNQFFIDNILLKEANQDIYLIKDSWSTPCECDTYNSGYLSGSCTANNSAERSMTGCQAYKGRDKKTYYLKSFTKLCSEQVVGCEALIDTENSSNPFGQFFNQDILEGGNSQGATQYDWPMSAEVYMMNTAEGGEIDKDLVHILPDSLVYRVNDQKKECNSKNKGCQKIGLPTLSAEGTPVSWTDLYIINDPDLYTTKPILCQDQYSDCTEYLPSGSSTSVYFRDPGEKLCEYRENVYINGENKSGWFKNGTDHACYSEEGSPYQPDGITYGVRWTQDPNYEGLVAVCPKKQSSCTQFVDMGATDVENLIRDGDFETQGSWSLTDNEYNPLPGIVELTQDPFDNNNQVLYINVVDAQDNPPESKYYPVHGAKQAAVINQSLAPGASYQLSARVYVPDDGMIGSLAERFTVYADLRYKGYKDETELKDCSTGSEDWCDDFRACYNAAGNQEPLCGSETNPAGNFTDPEKIEFAEKIWRIYDDKGDKLFDHDYRWAWDTAHAYRRTAGSISVRDSVEKGKWLDFASSVVAGGEDNPKNLLLEEIDIAAYLVGWGEGKPDGEIYVDDIEFKPIQNYYYLNDSKLDHSSCNGQASQKESCILILDTNQIDSKGEVTTSYNAFASYKKSEQASPQYSLVSPVNCNQDVNAYNCNGEDIDTDYCRYCYSYGLTKNDTNTILKVRPDRVCGEWLTCISSRTEWDKTTGEYKEICEMVGRCNKLAGGATGQCGNLLYDPTPNVLTEDTYKSRDVSWSGMDYSGYSIYNMYPIERLFAREDTEKPGVFHLTYDDISTPYEEGVDGSGDTTDPGKQIDKTCRAYPEKDSPFKSGINDKYYAEVNVCEDDGSDVFPSCQGKYTKAKYSGVTKYFGAGQDIWYGLCVGGEENNTECVSGDFELDKDTDPDTNSTCSDKNGICTARTEITQALGLRGFCLEPDGSKPTDIDACITWWPGMAVGDPDIYNQHPEAGYTAPIDQQYYCAERHAGDISSYGISSQLFNLDGSGNTDGRTILGYADGCVPFTSYDGNPYNDFCITGENGWGDLHFKTPSGLKKYMIQEIIFEEEVDFIVNQRDHSSCCSDFDWDCSNEGDIILNAVNDFHLEFGEWVCKGDKNGNRIEIRAIWSDNTLEGELIGFYIRFADESSGTGGMRIKNANIKLKNGCQLVVKVANDNGLTVAYTNRVNNIRNYYESFGRTEIIDGHSYSDECSPWGGLYNFDPDEVDYVAEGDNECNKDYYGAIYTSQDSLKDNLFAKSKEDDYRYILNTSSANYVYNNTSQGSWDETGDGNSPIIHSVVCDSISCNKGEENKLTIGDTDTGDIKRAKLYPAILKFYAKADKNQMPIKNININWDSSGQVTPYLMQAKNHQPVCCEANDSCENMNDPFNDLNFGNIPEACTEQYFQYSHYYFCSGAGSPGWDRNRNACIFKPEVTITDNWGKEATAVFDGEIIIKP